MEDYHFEQSGNNTSVVHSKTILARQEDDKGFKFLYFPERMEAISRRVLIRRKMKHKIETCNVIQLVTLANMVAPDKSRHYELLYQSGSEVGEINSNESIRKRV